jgi:hypothetical protein
VITLHENVTFPIGNIGFPEDLKIIDLQQINLQRFNHAKAEPLLEIK